jgi:hypothetical protein
MHYVEDAAIGYAGIIAVSGAIILYCLNGKFSGYLLHFFFYFCVQVFNEGIYAKPNSSQTFNVP